MKKKRQADILNRNLTEKFIKKLNSTEASLIAEINHIEKGILFKQGGWATPSAICKSNA